MRQTPPAPPSRARPTPWLRLLPLLLLAAMIAVGFGIEAVVYDNLALVALFMMALAGFYEPFLKLIDMARWQPGTRATLDVPWIALIGYPSLTFLFLLLWSRLMRRSPEAGRTVLLLASLTLLSFVHAAGLQGLKDLLGW